MLIANIGIAEVFFFFKVLSFGWCALEGLAINLGWAFNPTKKLMGLIWHNETVRKARQSGMFMGSFFSSDPIIYIMYRWVGCLPSPTQIHTWISIICVEMILAYNIPVAHHRTHCKRCHMDKCGGVRNCRGGEIAVETRFHVENGGCLGCFGEPFG